MTHKFQITTLKLSKPIQKSRSFYLLIKISQKYWFKTAQQHMNNQNTIPFMQTNEFEVPEDLMIYYSVALYERVGSGERLWQKKMLFKRDIKKEKLVFRMEDGEEGNGEVVATLEFRAVVQGNKANCSLGMLQDKIAQSATQLAQMQDATKLQLLSMGGLTYRFMNRLDPLVYFKNYLRQVLNWKHPLHTLLFGFLLTFFIFNPRLGLILSSAGLIYNKDTIFMKLENFSRKAKDRLVPPEENLKLIQGMMGDFCEVIDQMREVIFGEDKTEFIVMLNGIVVGAWVMIAVVVFVRLEVVLAVALWVGLLVGLEMSKVVVESMKNLTKKPLQILFTTISPLLTKPPFSTFTTLFSSLTQIQLPIHKTFYVFEYQRWWLGNWGQPYKHQCKWSDDKGILDVLPRTQPPETYRWVTDWRVAINLEETDEEGFSYGSDFAGGWRKGKKMLDVVRRRRWVRLCVREPQGNSQKSGKITHTVST